GLGIQPDGLFVHGEQVGGHPREFTQGARLVNECAALLELREVYASVGRCLPQHTQDTVTVAVGGAEPLRGDLLTHTPNPSHPTSTAHRDRAGRPVQGRPAVRQGFVDQVSSISVTRAATGERSERVRVTWANNGCPLSFSMTATTPS